MAKPDAKKWPQLKKYWDDYGMSIEWSQLFDMKVRSDGFYVVLAWKNSIGEVEMADIASDGNGKWDMQNDGCEPITMKQWERLEIVAHCDWYKYPSDEEIRLEQHKKLLAMGAKYRELFNAFEEGFDAGRASPGGDLEEKWFASETYEAEMKYWANKA